MEDWKALMSRNDNNTEDYEEEDIMWSNTSRYSPSPTTPNSSSSAWRSCSKTTPKSIPRRAQTAPNHEAAAKQTRQSSAPMNIPDWSKIYGLQGNRAPWVPGGGEEEGGEEEAVVPPHEWIARKVARSQIPSFSVCEGVGRTLKGRDLSKVRNAILTKTGFLEQ